MGNIFESPWPLVVTGAVVWVVILIYHAIFPAKKRGWHVLIPIVVALAGFGIDYFVKTDKEKIHSTINKAVKAVETQNISLLSTTIDRNYSDSFHISYDDIIRRAKNILSRPIIKKIHWSMTEIDIQAETSAASITARVLFEPDFQQYSSLMLVKAVISLRKQQNENWLIAKIDITEINNQPFKWDFFTYY